MDCDMFVRDNDDSINGTKSFEITSNTSLTEGMLLAAGWGLFSIFLAHAFNLIRRFAYQDTDNLDTDFDAGGRVSSGLTATTIVSQWTWAATLLQSSAVAANNGISGPFWYAAGATIPLLMFATLSVQMKTRAPGAKTFLQVIQARFGSRPHLVFCFFALLTNVIVTAMLMLGGCAVLTTLVQGLSLELAAVTLVTVIGACTFIGGLGATFYMSYFNTTIVFVVMFIFLIKVYHEGEDQERNPLGSIERVYELVSCSEGPEGNHARSYLTFLSSDSIMFGIINIVGNFGTVFVDQSYWQSSVAAKPREGMWGFLAAGLVWFSIPFTFATTMGLGYIALGTYYGEPLLSNAEVSAGLVPPAVAQSLMGKAGETLMVLMILMAVTSTGSAEVMAITSIIVYDLYQIHLKPFRRLTDSNCCILCGKSRGRMANRRDQCECSSMTDCIACTQDDKAISECNRTVKPNFKCKHHGNYRTYLNILRDKRDWCIVWVAMAIIPLTLLFDIIQVSLEFVYYFMGVLVGSSVFPIILSMFWARLTGKAIMYGAILGCLAGIFSWLLSASILNKEFNMSKFITNSAGNEFEISMLIANCVAIFSGAAITIIMSFVTKRHISEFETAETWEKTRDIDNPLSPWPELYIREFHITEMKLVYNRPSLEQMMTEFKKTNIIAFIVGSTTTILMIVFWPAVMTAIDIMSQSQFKQWIHLSDVWSFTAGIFIIATPLFMEIYSIVTQFKHKNARVRVHAAPEHELNNIMRSASPQVKTNSAGQLEQFNV
ncbi:LOW QUALITY PROTEIN: uncharacterized protein [Amphiura filiformis]|uniref:LOW QUALITY PROTEIN: uncharacterized protein n=1 Tax=Amphiura filiformis TaxID=82378 RepID=UPI003B22769B